MLIQRDMRKSLERDIPGAETFHADVGVPLSRAAIFPLDQRTIEFVHRRLPNGRSERLPHTDGGEGVYRARQHAHGRHPVN